MRKNNHFLDVIPLDWTRLEVQELHGLFSKIYFREDEVIRLTQRSGFPVEGIRWGISMSAAWHEIMEKAHDRGQLKSIIDVVLRDASKAEYHERINELLLTKPIVALPSIKDIDWYSNLKTDTDHYERIIGDRSTLLDIAFLQQGLYVSKAVARITVTFSEGQYYGTGFLISQDLILTNHHVLFNHGANNEMASSVELWFDYERAFHGGLISKREAQGKISSIVGEKQFDWAVVKLTEPIDKTYQYLKLGGKKPSVDDRVYIIQHPNGTVKQIGLHNNIVRHIDKNIIQYWTDTDGGSSGSPVFNSNWEVVALHQGWDKVQHHSRDEYRNQGVNIECVIRGLKEHGVTI